MHVLRTLKNIALSTALLFAPGCAASHVFLNQIEPIYVVEDEKLVNYSPERSVPKGGDLQTTLETDTYSFTNRFRAHLYIEAHDRIDIDLQQSAIRDYSCVYNTLTFTSFVHRGVFSNNNYAETIERDFTNSLYTESRRIAIKALRDTFKDLDFYYDVKPFFEFDLRRDKVPFTNKTLSDLAPSDQKKQDTPVPNLADDYDERILNPQKYKTNEKPSIDWLSEKVTHVYFGMNVNFDIPKAGAQVGIEPYVKWFDVFKLTYSTADHTLEHKISFPLYNLGFGLSAKTDDRFTTLKEVDFSFTHTFNDKAALRIGQTNQFDDNRYDAAGASFEVFIKF